MKLEDSNEKKIVALSPKSLVDRNQPVEQILSDLQIERLELPIETARKVAYALGILFLLIIIWASLAPVNVISKGTGQLRPYGKPKLVQSQVSGQVEAILVKEGSHVDKNQVLVELDSSIYRTKLDKAQIEFRKAKNKLVQTTDSIEALESVLKNPDTLPTVSTENEKAATVIEKVYTTYLAMQESKFDAQTSSSTSSDINMSSEMSDLKNMQLQYELEKSQKNREIELLKQQLETGTNQKKTGIKGLEEKIVSHKEILKEVKNVLALSKEQEKDYAEVVDLGVSRVQYLKVKQQVAENSKNVQNEISTIAELKNKLAMQKLELTKWQAQTKSRIVELEAAKKGLTANIDSVKIKMRKSQRAFKNEKAAYEAAVERAQATLNSTKKEIGFHQKQIKELQDSMKLARLELQKAIVRAPMSGLVTAFKVRGEGEVVRSGQHLMEILPDHSDLVIEAKIANKDIGFVKLKQSAKVKLDAFPYQDFGVIEGTVEDIEKYPEKDGKKGYAYTVWIKPKQNFIEARGKKITLRSGLTSKVEIIVRQETVLRALLSPIAKLTDISVKE